MPDLPDAVGSVGVNEHAASGTDPDAVTPVFHDETYLVIGKCRITDGKCINPGTIPADNTIHDRTIPEYVFMVIHHSAEPAIIIEYSIRAMQRATD